MKMDEAIRSVTGKFEKAIESLPKWVQWVVLGASIAALLSEVWAFLIRGTGR
jgi:hypothetical protein